MRKLCRIALALAFGGLGPRLTTAVAQTPQRGGTLVFGVEAEPPNYDCHQGNTFVILDLVAPIYSLLIRFDPNDMSRFEPDLATSWETSADGLSYIFRLRQGVQFHDGSPFSSADVKASFDRIRLAPDGIVSQHKAAFDAVASVDTPDANTVVFHLKQVDAGLMNNIASPWSCIYSAAKLAVDERFPERHLLGTGPFQFVEHVPGSTFTAKRFEHYFLPDRPYLDGYRAEFVSGAGMINGLSGGRLMAAFRGISPAERDRIRAARGDQMQFLENDHWVQLFQITFNTRRPPFNDIRVRQALSMAIDRWGSAAGIARVSFLGPVSDYAPAGSFWALPKATLQKYPGFSTDIAASRKEAQHLLQEAGVPNLKFRLLNRTQLSPYSEFGVFLLDQWRRIGLNVEQDMVETGPWQNARNHGDYDVMVEAMSEHSDDPSVLLVHFLSADRSPINYSGSIDRTVDDLFDQQQRTLDPAARQKIVWQMHEHMLEQSVFAPVFWADRIIPLASNVHGWVITPSHFVGQDLRDVWLSH
jgi:peptide/nickel transport system substrate-binding protein